MRTDRRADRRTDSRTGGHYAKKKRGADWTELSGALRTPRNMVRSVVISVPPKAISWPSSTGPKKKGP